MGMMAWHNRRRRMGGGARAYYQKVQGTSPIAYWRLNETAGAAADDLMSVINGTYTNVTLNSTTFINSDPAPLFVKAASSRVRWLSTPIPACNLPEGSIMVWAKVSEAVWGDGAQGHICNFTVDANNLFQIIKGSAGHQLMCYYYAGATIETLSHYTDYTDWMHIIVTWSKANERARLYFNKDIVISTAGLGVWGVGDLAIANTAIGSQTSGGFSLFAGNACNLAIWNRELQQAEVNNLWLDEFPGDKRIFYLGDSKTWNNWWPENVCNQITTASGEKYRELTPRLAVGGYDINALDAYVTTNLPSVSGTPAFICINIGTNDARKVVITPEVDFKADYNNMIATLQAKWPGVPIYLQHVYRNDDPVTAANSTTINGYIDDIIAAGVGLNAGPDDETWAENGDGGATYLQADKIHYNDAGQQECANQWKTVLGF